MTLLQVAATRQLKHRRQIDVQVYARADALWKVDAVLIDTQSRLVHMAKLIDTRGSVEGASQPFQIDRCHALRSTGQVGQPHYPRWFQPVQAP